jgi:Transcription factor Tfb4
MEDDLGELVCINIDLNPVYWAANKTWNIEQLVNDFVVFINIFLSLKGSNNVAFYICSGGYQSYI